MEGSALAHFDIKDTEIATCKHCKETISYRSLKCLEDHLKDAHDGRIVDEQDRNSDEEDSGIPSYTIRIKENLKDNNTDNTLWEYFTIKSTRDKLATCNLCEEPFSYSDEDTLANHLSKRHAIEVKSDDEEEMVVERIDMTDDEGDKRCKLRSNAWNYFTPLNNPYKKEAKCKICAMVLSYKSTVSNLMKHVHRKHKGLGGVLNFKTEPVDGDDITPSKPARLALWPYFKKVDKTAMICECLICHSNVSYAHSTRAMSRHMKAKHPQLNVSDKNDGSKRIILSSTGEIYEVEDDAMMSDHDNTKSEEMPLEAVYLDDDFENLLQDVKSPKRKRKTTRSTSAKRIQMRNDSSDEEVTVYNNIPTNGRAKECDTLDFFGKYIVSLLRQLPKAKAFQLQSEFVKQIVLEKLNSEICEKSEHNVDSNQFSVNGTK